MSWHCCSRCVLMPSLASRTGTCNPNPRWLPLYMGHAVVTCMVPQHLRQHCVASLILIRFHIDNMAQAPATPLRSSPACPQPAPPDS
jgi:hypothetical protein